MEKVREHRKKSAAVQLANMKLEQAAASNQQKEQEIQRLRNALKQGKTSATATMPNQTNGSPARPGMVRPGVPQQNQRMGNPRMMNPRSSVAGQIPQRTRGRPPFQQNAGEVCGCVDWQLTTCHIGGDMTDSI